MGRRMIASNLGRSKSLSAVSLLAEVSFLHAISVANDHGLLEADPTLLRADLFPRRLDVTTEELMTAIDELVAEGCLHRYEAEGETYLHFPHWLSYQRLRTPNPGAIPFPEGNCEECSSIEVELRSRSRSRSVCRQVDNKVPQDDTDMRQVAASRGKSRQVDDKTPPTTPPALTDKEMQRLESWCEEHHPHQVLKVHNHVEQMVEWYTDEGKTKKSWYRTAQAWIRRNDEWRQDGTDRNGDGRRGAKGILEQIHDDAVARAGGE